MINTLVIFLISSPGVKLKFYRMLDPIHQCLKTSNVDRKYLHVTHLSYKAFMPRRELIPLFRVVFTRTWRANRKKLKYLVYGNKIYSLQVPLEKYLINGKRLILFYFFFYHWPKYFIDVVRFIHFLYHYSTCAMLLPNKYIYMLRPTYFHVMYFSFTLNASKNHFN